MTDLFEPSNDLAQNNLRDELLNKWKDRPLPEVLEAKINADLHIKTLEKNNAEMRQMYLDAKEELTAKAKWDDYFDRLKSPSEPPVAPPPANEVKEPKMDIMDYKKVASETFQELEAQKRETENAKRVQNKLIEKYGENYVTLLKDQQANLGLSSDEINSLAKKSPEALFRMLGLNDTPKNDYVTPPRGSQRNDNFAPRTQRRDYAYYQEMKKTNPRLYLDPKIQNQMELDATEMGMSFFS